MKKLITTNGTKYAQNLKAFAIIDDKQTDGKPQMFSAADLEEAFENASEADKAAFESVIHFDVEGEEITVTPTTSQQVKTPGTGYNAITKATINAVTSSIDNNIIASNIKRGVTILGVTGTLDEQPVDWDGTGVYRKLYFKDNITITPELEGVILTAITGMTGEPTHNIDSVLLTEDNETIPGYYVSINPSSDSISFKIQDSLTSATQELSIEYAAEEGDEEYTAAIKSFTNTYSPTYIENTNGIKLSTSISFSDVDVEKLVAAVFYVYPSEKIADTSVSNE